VKGQKIILTKQESRPDVFYFLPAAQLAHLLLPRHTKPSFWQNQKSQFFHLLAINFLFILPLKLSVTRLIMSALGIKFDFIQE